VFGNLAALSPSLLKATAALVSGRFADLPKNKDVLNMKKVDDKIGSVLLGLTTEDWRQALKESHIRSLARSAGALRVSFQQCEHVACLKLCDELNDVVAQIHNAMKSILVYMKDMTIANVEAMAAPIRTLKEALIQRYPKKDFDDELFLLWRLLAMGHFCVAAESSPKPAILCHGQVF
jgi:hypothetical protein